MQFVCVEGQKLNEVSNTLSAPKLLIKHACCQQISNVIHLQELIHQYLTLDFTSIFMKTVLLSTN